MRNAGVDIRWIENVEDILSNELRAASDHVAQKGLPKINALECKTCPNEIGARDNYPVLAHYFEELKKWGFTAAWVQKMCPIKTRSCQQTMGVTDLGNTRDRVVEYYLLWKISRKDREELLRAVDIYL